MATETPKRDAQGRFLPAEPEAVAAVEAAASEDAGRTEKQVAHTPEFVKKYYDHSDPRITR